MRSRRLPLELLVAWLLVGATMSLACAAPSSFNPSSIEEDAIGRNTGPVVAGILAAFLARDVGALDRVLAARNFDALTVSAHYSSGMLNCPANPRRCENITLTLMGWRSNQTWRLGAVRFAFEDFVSADQARAMRLERSSPAAITAVVERLVFYKDGFARELWLLVRPDENTANGEIPRESLDRVAATRQRQRQKLVAEGFALADVTPNSDLPHAGIPEVTPYFHLLGSVSPQNVDTIGPTTVGLLNALLRIDPS